MEEISKEENFRDGILYQSSLNILCSLIPNNIEKKFLWYGVPPNEECTPHGRDVFKKYYSKNNTRYFIHPSFTSHVDEDLRAIMVVLLQEKKFFLG